ncbi:MAG: hypothetical protein NVS3B18_16480 [Candidatus Dormibacteria bacterium]
MPSPGPAAREPRLIDLGQPLFTGMPASAVHGSARIWAEEPFGPDFVPGCLISVTHVDLALHVGTHVDAPRHFFADGKTVTDYPLERFVRPAVTAHLPLDGEVPVSREQLRAALGQVEPGDFVLVCFDYALRFRDPQYFHHPYLTEDAAQLVVELGASGFGTDTLTPDQPAGSRAQDFAFPAHQTLLGNDVLIFENLGPGLREIAGRRVPVSAVPLPVAADGSLVAPYADVG